MPRSTISLPSISFRNNGITRPELVPGRDQDLVFIRLPDSRQSGSPSSISALARSCDYSMGGAKALHNRVVNSARAVIEANALRTLAMTRDDLFPPEIRAWVQDLAKEKYPDVFHRDETRKVMLIWRTLGDCSPWWLSALNSLGLRWSVVVASRPHSVAWSNESAFASNGLQLARGAFIPEALFEFLYLAGVDDYLALSDERSPNSISEAVTSVWNERIPGQREELCKAAGRSSLNPSARRLRPHLLRLVDHIETYFKNGNDLNRLTASARLALRDMLGAADILDLPLDGLSGEIHGATEGALRDAAVGRAGVPQSSIVRI